MRSVFSPKYGSSSASARYGPAFVLRNALVSNLLLRPTPSPAEKQSGLKGSVPKVSTKIIDQKKKLILVYTALFNNREWYHLPEREAKDYAKTRGCRINDCEITYDNNRLKESDAVLFHARDMPSADSLRRLRQDPSSYHQRWVYFISENPINTPSAKYLDGLFNWTMTYKQESDIWIPYQRFLKLDPSEAVPKVVDYAAKKNKLKPHKLALWVSSHCGVFRDRVVRKLQEHISIDVAGGCGSQFKNHLQTCGRDGPNSCMEKAKNYKFYLSFENAFCDQYVTEKYWYNAMQHDAIPIVLGGGPYDDSKTAIPGSFIDVQSFPTIKKLADYLMYLDKNDTAYNEYFAWKQKYKLPQDEGWPYPDIWSCAICEKLHTEHEVKVYDKLSDFWSLNDCSGRDKKANEMVSKG